MNRKTLFRLLVGVSCVAFLSRVFMPYFYEALAHAFGWKLKPDIEDLLSWDGYYARISIPTGIRWLLVALWMAVAVGIATFSRSARVCFAMLVVFDLCMRLVSGFRVETASEAFISMLINMLTGAILVMAYTPPLKGLFETDAELPPPLPERQTRDKP